MCSHELETRRKYPQAEAKAAGVGIAGGWVILSGRGPMADVLGRGDTKEDAWAEAARHVAAKAA